VKALVVDALASGRGERHATRDAIGAGPRAVVGVLGKAGVDARIVEAEATLRDGLPEGYDLLFLSGMTSDLISMRKVASLWRDGPILVGGPATADPEQALRKTGGEVAIVGEGERTILDLLKGGLSDGVVPDREALAGITGIAFRSGDHVAVNPLRPAMTRREYDEFEPSIEAVRGYSLFRAARVYVEALRGCSNYRRARFDVECGVCGRCTTGGLESRYDCPAGIPPGCGYCSVPSLFGPPRSRSTGKILREVEGLLREGVRRVVLSAPCFLDYGRDLLVEPEPLTDPRSPEPNYTEVEELLSELTSLPQMSDGLASVMIENLKPQLVTERAATILGRYLSGTPVSIGFETGSAEHGALLGRSSTPEETLTAVRRLRRAGLKPYVYFIHGLPGQSRETVDATVGAIGKSMDEGAERVILYRFQSLPMSAFSGFPSAPPNVRDPGSKRIHDAAARANMRSKESLVGARMRVVAAERYPKDRRYIVAYPLKHGPVTIVDTLEPLEGEIIDVEVTGIASERMVLARPVAKF